MPVWPDLDSIFVAEGLLCGDCCLLTAPFFFLLTSPEDLEKSAE
jgi:hypothetical protein